MLAQKPCPISGSLSLWLHGPQSLTVLTTTQWYDYYHAYDYWLRTPTSPLGREHISPLIPFRAIQPREPHGREFLPRLSSTVFLSLTAPSRLGGEDSPKRLLVYIYCLSCIPLSATFHLVSVKIDHKIKPGNTWTSRRYWE